MDESIDTSTDEYSSDEDEDELCISTLHPDIIKLIIPLADHPIENSRLVSILNSLFSNHMSYCFQISKTWNRQMMDYVNNRRNHAPLYSLVLKDIGEFKYIYHPSLTWRMIYRFLFLGGSYSEVTVQATNRMPRLLTHKSQGIFKEWTDERTSNNNASFLLHFFRILSQISESLCHVSSATSTLDRK